jgi:opacity protein-like surface antigen
MRATRLMALGLMLAVLGSTGIATAEQGPANDFDREGLYLGAGAGYALDAWRNDLSIYPTEGTWDVNLVLGYRVSKWAALDIRVEYAHDFLKDSETSSGAITSTVNVKAYPLAEILDNRYQPYLTGGIGAMATIVGESGTPGLPGSTADWAFRVGGGADIYITRNWAVNLELAYIAPVADVRDYNYASFGAGFMYRF